MVPTKFGGISLKDTLESFLDLVSPKQQVKINHTFGHLFKFKFEANTANVQSLGLKGIFKGSDYRIGRFSSANRIHHSRSRPSIGLKFLRDGQHSADLLIQKKRSPVTDSHNPFLECMSNAIPNPYGPLEKKNYASRAVIKHFEMHTNRTDYIGLSDLAMYGQDGVAIKPDDVKFPFLLHFQPNEDITQFCKGKSLNVTSDFTHFPCLEDLSVGSLLYKVYAVHDPKAHNDLNQNDVVHIGDIINTSEFVKSKFGDNKLHFTHMTFERNMKNMLDSQRHKLWIDSINDEYMNNEICDKYVKFTKS